MGCIKLEETDIPTCFEFINGFSLLLIGTTNGNIYFINFHLKNNSLSFTLKAFIELKSAEFSNKILLDFGLSNSNLFIKGQELINPKFYEDFKVYIATNVGNVRVFTISSLFEDN